MTMRSRGKSGEAVMFVIMGAMIVAGMRMRNKTITKINKDFRMPFDCFRMGQAPGLTPGEYGGMEPAR